MEKLKKFEIIYINRKFQKVCLYVEGYSHIIEENSFKNKFVDEIHEFIGIEFIKYI